MFEHKNIYDELTHWFGKQMADTLKENHWKGGHHKMTLGALSKRLHEEAHELSRAIQKGKPGHEIIKEAVDVANFALFIADVVFQREQGNPWYKLSI